MKSYLPIIASLFLFSTPLVLPATASETEIVATEINPYIKDNIAREISVKITSDDNSGSGVIIAQDDNTYLVLTNNHVLRDGEEFAIATHDGVTHQATFVENAIDTGDDLALLQFTSDRSYQTATINTAATPRVEQTILAVGYSAQTGELVTEAGKIEQVPDKSFKEGYSIGYTSNVVGGMSGGAIINTDGEVIGINGKSAFPIINTGYDNEDGTKPSAEEIEQYRKLSWGLSINRLLARVNPEIITAYSLPLPETTDSIESPELTGWLGELEAKAKQITVRIDSSSGANGSGVIIAKEGNTYTVLTADHVICESEPKSRDCIDYSYEIVAPDGQKYPVNIETIKRQEGVDLATVRFTSNENYQVAQLANYPITKRDVVFVAGYPKLNQNTPAQWLFSLGFGTELGQGLLQVSDNSLKSDSDLVDTYAGGLAGGYEMVYSSLTYGGMSGGAVLDRDGRVIGIHGLAEGQTALNSQSGSATQIQLGHSLGIPVKTFVGLADRLGVAGLPVQENRAKLLNEKEVDSFYAATLGAEISQSNAKPEKWLERGNQLWQLRRNEEAVEAFDLVIALNPKFVHLAHYGKGLALLSSQKREAALASMELATKVQPNFAPAFYRKHGLLRSLDRLEAALEAVESAIALQPDNANYHSQKGEILSELKRYRAAETACSQAIAINPRSIFYINRGVIYKKQGKLELALSDYDRAIAINPNSAMAHYNRGNVFQDQGKLELALSDYDRAIALNPNDAKGHYNRGVLYSNQGKPELALSDYDRAIALNPDLAEAYFNRALIYEKSEKLKLALSDLNQAIAINPNLAIAYSNRGNLYLKQGKSELALSDYNKAIAINPDLAEAHFNRGVLYYDQGKLELALSDLNQAIAIDPNGANAYSNRGIVYLKQGKSELALSNYNKAIAINPDLAEAHFNRGVLYSKIGKPELALSDLDRAIALNPNFTNAYNYRGIVYLKQGKSELALSDYTQAIAINPNFAYVYFNRAYVYDRHGKSELALSDYTQAIAINPNYAEAYNNRASVYDRQGKLELALSDYNKAIAINPNDAHAYNNRASVYDRQGKLELALSDYNQAIAINPNSAEAHTNLGLIHMELRNIEKARFNLEKAQQLFIAQGNIQSEEQVKSLLQQLSKQERSQLAQVGESSPNSADKDSAEALYKRGGTYFEQQDYDSAIDTLTQAIEIAPEYAEAYRLRGTIYLIQKKYELAISDLSKVIEIDPEYAQAHKMLGVAYTNSGDINAGISTLEKAQQLYTAQGNTQEEEETKGMLQYLSKLERSESAQASKPNVNPANESEVTADGNDDSAEAQYQLGVTYFKQQDFDSAIAAFTQAIEIDPEHAEAYRLRGIIYTTQKKHDLAIGDLNKVVKISPNDANAHQLLGMAYLTAGNTEATISNLEKAQQLSIAQGDDKTAKEISKLLEIFK